MATQEHQWDDQTKGGKEQCSRCKLIRVAGTAGGRIISYAFYRGNKYVGDDMPGKVPPCDERFAKK